MLLIYFILAATIALSIVQASLEKHGVHKIENLQQSASTLAIAFLAIPLTLLSNLGVIGVAIWSFFALPWLPAIGVVGSAYVIFGLAWGGYLATLKRGPNWTSVVLAGPKILFGIRLITSGCVIYLAISFWDLM